ncbi:unnamed protein product [Prorocentrum cordatum]|uniref:Uncharacterized protein n=1 Tax=Prorocentrum cordatum TaxID=2364126 RepID=A0ABN9UHZ5_9DINO|nr:unnamed protein product [Polarella glacialis]
MSGEDDHHKQQSVETKADAEDYAQALEVYLQDVEEFQQWACSERGKSNDAGIDFFHRDLVRYRTALATLAAFGVRGKIAKSEHK